jgi:RNA-binding protein YlmH
MDKSKKTILLDKYGTTAEERLVLARVLDKFTQAEQKNIPLSTDFLSPKEQSASQIVLRQAGAERYVLLGGYPGAERNIFLFLPTWMEPENAQEESPLRAIRGEFRPEYQLSHRDILGSLMAMGVTREKIGDILVSKDHCDLFVLESVEEFLLQNWAQSGRAAIKTSRISPEDVQSAEKPAEEIRDTVMSLRLDAVASSAFRMSRTKAADLIAGGQAQVNWQDCVKPDRMVAAGDVISLRGWGKCKLEEVGGLTRKGRTSILMKRYI